MQGGSTLTQQLAKNLFLTQERTVSRKIQEAILALWLEHNYSKDQILELYLNRVYFGSGAFGVEAAAQQYFGHGARQVTLAEAAMLAGLMKAPTKLAPNRNPAARPSARPRWWRRWRTRASSPTAWPRSRSPSPRTPCSERRGSVNYAADYVMDVLDDTIGAIDDDIVVTTTISLPLQTLGDKALTEELDKKGGEVRREPGRARRAGPRAGDPRARRRPQLRREPVQPRGGGEAPAGLLVQAVRLPRRAGARPDARHACARTRRSTCAAGSRRTTPASTWDR